MFKCFQRYHATVGYLAGAGVDEKRVLVLLVLESSSYLAGGGKDYKKKKLII
jgi:hypothetical protein